MPLVVDEVVKLQSAGTDYVFHVPTSSFFELDRTSQEILDTVGNRVLEDDEVLPSLVGKVGADETELPEIIGDLVRLRLLVPPELRGHAEHDRAPRNTGLRNLVLHVAHACNLACGYCYAEQGLYKGKSMVLDLETARKYVDWFFGQADPEARQLGITFFGGEPLLNFPVIEWTARYALEKAAEANKTLHFGITTNGTLVTPEIVDFLEEIGARVTVSLDAIGEANDRLRPYVSGKGSYDEILRKIRPLLDRRLAVSRVTVTRSNLDVVHTVETLLNEGFVEVGCSPVDAGDERFDLTGYHYAKLLDGFNELTRRFIEGAAAGTPYGFSNISNILKAIHHGHNKEYPCGAGLQMVAGSPTGEMSLCHRFVGEKDYVLGSLDQGGINKTKRLEVLDAIHLDQRSDCGSCWARYICAGGCHHVNFLFEGDPSQTYLTHCDWLRAWYQTGLSAYAEILQRNPTYISRFIDPGWVCSN